MGPEVGGHGFGGDGDVAQFGAGVGAEFGAEEVELETFWGAEEAVFVADAGGEADPGFDGEGAVEGDVGIDPGVVAAVEEEDFLEEAAELLLEFFDGGVVAEDGGEALDGGGVEVGLGEGFVEEGGDDGLGAGFGGGEGVQRVFALGGGEFGE